VFGHPHFWQFWRRGLPPPNSPNVISFAAANEPFAAATFAAKGLLAFGY
jgi:hypothetical protein